MTTINTSASRVAQAYAVSKPAASRTAAAGSTSVAPARSVASAITDTVDVSGRSLMLSRIFVNAAKDANGDPEFHLPDTGRSAGSVYSFLTSADRDMIAGVYELAQADGTDLLQVDHLAFDLGCYRSQTSSAYVDSVGLYFQESGEPLTFTFPADDEAAAKRILTSKAVKDSAVPQDFLRHALNPGRAPVHAVDLAFLEKVVYATSRGGSDGATDPSAILAPRPLERLAEMRAAGLIPSPAEVRRTMFGHTNPDQDPFDRYAPRLGVVASQLTTDDKTLLGNLYASTEAKSGDRDNSQMRNIDKLARTMITMRVLGYPTGHDQRTQAQRSPDRTPKASSSDLPDRAPRPLMQAIDRY